LAEGIEAYNDAQTEKADAAYNEVFAEFDAKQ
jgi:hypothetical protein